MIDHFCFVDHSVPLRKDTSVNMASGLDKQMLKIEGAEVRFQTKNVLVFVWTYQIKTVKIAT